MADRPYQRHHNGVCSGDAALGNFMQHLSHFLAGVENPTHFTDDDGFPREGIAYTWKEWAHELGLSLKQFKRVRDKAVALGYIVRAVRLWGKYRMRRLHVTITEKYIIELTRCVALDHEAYREAVNAARRFPIANVEGRDHISHLDGTLSHKMGDRVSPYVGCFIEDSSHTHEQTLRETATSFAVADSPSAFPETESKKEKSEILESESIQETNQIPEEEEIQRAKPENANGEDSHLTHTINFGVADLTVTTSSVELFDKLSAGNAKDAGHVATVTSRGLATKLSELGLLVTWQKECADYGVPSPDNVTDEQLAALTWWCSHIGPSLPPSLKQMEKCIKRLIEDWDDFAEFSISDEGKERCLKATEKPDLDFVRQVVDMLRDNEPSKPKETQTVARPQPAKPAKPHKTLAEMQNKMTKEETLAYFAEWQREIEAEPKPKEGNVYQGIHR